MVRLIDPLNIDENEFKDFIDEFRVALIDGKVSQQCSQSLWLKLYFQVAGYSLQLTRTTSGTMGAV